MIVSVSPKSMCNRVDQARPGEWIMYHVGYLINDRNHNTAVRKIGDEMRRRYRDGELTMVQRKLGDMMYEYYAVKL